MHCAVSTVSPAALRASEEMNEQQMLDGLLPPGAEPLHVDADLLAPPEPLPVDEGQGDEDDRDELESQTTCTDLLD